MSIRISLGHIDEYDDSVGVYALQLGLRSVQLHTPSNLPGVDGYWSISELAALRARCDQAGVLIEGLEDPARSARTGRTVGELSEDHPQYGKNRLRPAGLQLSDHLCVANVDVG
jgi:hypothetical protein